MTDDTLTDAPAVVPTPPPHPMDAALAAYHAARDAHAAAQAAYEQTGGILHAAALKVREVADGLAEDARAVEVDAQQTLDAGKGLFDNLVAKIESVV